MTRLKGFLICTVLLGVFYPPQGCGAAEAGGPRAVLARGGPGAPDGGPKQQDADTSGSPSSGPDDGVDDDYWSRSFALSHRGPGATITRIVGVNTSDAAMTGRVMERDARDYCDRDPNGDTSEHGGRMTVEQCVAKALREEGGPQYSVTADCTARTIDSTLGRYRLVGQGDAGGLRWRSAAGRVIEGGSSGADEVSSQFEKLCPAAVPRE